MKFILPIFTGAVLATASAVPRAEPTGTYNVTNAFFTSSTFAKGDGTAHYSFNISDSLRSAHTSCSISFANNEYFPTFNYTACEDPLWSFALEKTGATGSSSSGNGPYRLRVTHYQVIDGHKTNNETACNSNDAINNAPSMNPTNTGTTSWLAFANATGGHPDIRTSSTFTMPWVYGPGSNCP